MMRKPRTDIKTLIFCDESKFYLNDGDYEDAIYYFGVAVPTAKVKQIHAEFENALIENRIKSKVFHSTSIFQKKRLRTDLMNELTQIIVRNGLQCFCHKYPKQRLFEATKILSRFNSDIINFEKAEFQALFYFLIMLNTFLRDEKPDLLEREVRMYFDRNVYGVKAVETFEFSSEDFVFKDMTFVEKSQISLLALPDLFGYIFRKSKIHHNRNQAGESNSNPSELTKNSSKCLLEINQAGLFHFWDCDLLLEKALKNL